MDKFNCTHLNVKQRHSSSHERIFKAHIHYFKACDKKLYKMNKSMVNVLSNLSTVLWHTLIKDLEFMLLVVDLPPKDELRSDDELSVHVHCVDKQDNIQNVDIDIWYKFQELIKFHLFEFKIHIVDHFLLHFSFVMHYILHTISYRLYWPIPHFNIDFNTCTMLVFFNNLKIEHDVNNL
jgi:hypothetical protein